MSTHSTNPNTKKILARHMESKRGPDLGRHYFAVWVAYSCKVT